MQPLGLTRTRGGTDPAGTALAPMLEGDVAWTAAPCRRGRKAWRDRRSQAGGRMPEISRFLGILIVMYYRDHAAAHFHAKYGPHEITVRLADGVVEGRFPRRALGHVMEWYALHREGLFENWELARSRKPLRRIPPLE
jgi:hypothetical protein